jgi:hypothetical protein
VLRVGSSKKLDPTGNTSFKNFFCIKCSRCDVNHIPWAFEAKTLGRCPCWDVFDMSVNRP